MSLAAAQTDSKLELTIAELRAQLARAEGELHGKDQLIMAKDEDRSPS